MVQFIGMDVHRKNTVACIYDPASRSARYETLPTDEDRLAEFVEAQPGKVRLAFEVSGLAGRLYDRLRPLVDDLQVANPSQTPWIYRTPTKTDRIDAKKLAVLMSVGQLPTVHMPAAEIREWRGLIKGRQHLVQERNRVKNRIRALLANEGIRRQERGRWWTKKNIRWIQESKTRLSPAMQVVLDNYVDHLDLLNKQARRITDELDRRAENHPGVALLRTIPGVGPRTAEALIAFVDDVRRFARNRHVGAYFGLVPRLDESGGRSRRGHISKRGPSVVRWLLGQAAWRAVKDSPAMKAFYERVMHGQKERKKIAIVAVARKLTVIASSMLRTGEEYSEARTASPHG